jgi:hypothetical protein
VKKNTFLLVAVACVVAGAAIALGQGGIYNKTVFYGDVSVGSWSAVQGFTNTVAASGGSYGASSGTNHVFYRMTATNAAGRLPWTATLTNTFTSASGVSNKITLAWTAKDGVRSHVIGKSTNETDWVWYVAGPSVATLVDTGSLTWTNVDSYTSMTQLGTPTVPWPDIGTSGTTPSQVTNIVRAVNTEDGVVSAATSSNIAAAVMIERGAVTNGATNAVLGAVTAGTSAGASLRGSGGLNALTWGMGGGAAVATGDGLTVAGALAAGNIGTTGTLTVAGQQVSAQTNQLYVGQAGTAAVAQAVAWTGVTGAENVITNGWGGSVNLGPGTTASGDFGSSALGVDTTASGSLGATATGYSTTASGSEGATAQGNSTTASGEVGATAQGDRTIASGNYGATAQGAGAIASNDSSYVWSSNRTIPYGSHGTGTFSINPIGGAGGVWIGETNLVALIPQHIGIPPYATVSGTSSNALALGDIAAASYATNVGPVTLTSAATVTVSYAKATEWQLAVTNPSVTLTMGSDWPTNAAHYVPVSVLLGTNEWRYNGASITNWAGASFPSLTNAGPSSLILHRPAWGVKWAVRGGYVQ